MKGSIIIMMSFLINVNGGAGYKKEVLKNGLKVLAYEKTKLPMVVCIYSFKIGSIHDPKGKEGLVNLLVSMLEKGTEKRTYTQIGEEFAILGTRFSYDVSRTFSTLGITTLSENLEKSLEILSDIIYNPTFPKEEFEKEKERLINEIISNKSEPDYVSEILFTKYICKDHPLGHLPEGDENSLKNINLEDIKEFYKKYFVPENAICVIVGPQSPDELIDFVKKYFEKEKKGENLPWFRLPPPISGINVKIFHMNINQSYITMGHFGPLRKSPDFNAARVMNYIFGGGGFSSRLFEEIRNKRGYAYSVGSGFLIIDPYPSLYTFGLQTKIENTNDAIRVIFEEINKIKREIKDKEIEDTKSYFKGYLPRITETYYQIATNLLTQELYELPEFFWEKEIKEIENLKKDEIIEAARKYLDPQNILIIIVTDTSKYKWKVEGIENVNVEIIQKL
ncbi:MAG: pitrilysin family protein [candidate division WOR-3 bacterium]